MKFTGLVFTGILFASSLFGAGELSGRKAPGFSLMDSSYQQHDLTDYRGKVVIIDFMLTTCPVCNKLADTLVAFKAKYGDKVAILSIVTLPDNFQTTGTFASNHKITWSMLFDSGQVMMSYLKLKPGNMDVHFPHVFLIDTNGQIRNDFDGSDERTIAPSVLMTEIDKLVVK